MTVSLREAPFGAVAAVASVHVITSKSAFASPALVNFFSCMADAECFASASRLHLVGASCNVVRAVTPSPSVMGQP